MTSVADVLVDGWRGVDSRTMLAFKCAVAASGASVLAWGMLLRQAGRPHAWRRVRDVLLGTIGVLAFCCWWNLGRFHFPEFLQIHEHYHYYLGSKYSSELGYTRLYQCTAAADIEDGFGAEVARRWIRNLATNEMERGVRSVPDPIVCTRFFSADRWESFKRDVRWFRQNRSAERWDMVFVDHGYNATPVWAIAGGTLAGLAPASDRQIHALALLDPALLLVMWGSVWWAFGWRTMCVALIWWGTNFPARYYWTGGAYLRTDWLAALTIAICLARRGHLFLCGFAATFSALLRIFPGFTLVAIALAEGARFWRARTLMPSPNVLRLAAGCVLGFALLLSLAAERAGGIGPSASDWSGFVTNSQKHLDTPATNTMGLKAVLSYELASRTAILESNWVDVPWDVWMAERRRVFAGREPLFWLLVAAFTALLLCAVRGQDEWLALVLGAGLVPVTLDMACYYYSMLLVFAFLWTRHEWIGAALAGLSTVTSLIPAALDGFDDIYTAESIAVLLFVVAVTVQFALQPGPVPDRQPAPLG